ncbi:CD99 antigen [Apodemus speciosus]|uniref:CD99 antigen n=1 Tax=Apodemus speciosus TaxID=105296 RepID=A0ABQ0FVM5_APOSI
MTADDDFRLKDRLSAQVTRSRRPRPRPRKGRQTTSTSRTPCLLVVAAPVEMVVARSRPAPEPAQAGREAARDPGRLRDTFDDRDLEDVAGRGGAETEGTPQGLVPGVVAAVVAAVAGAASSFIAYQKKKLCFREGGGLRPCVGPE